MEDAWHVLMFLLTEMSFEEDESYHVSSFFYEDEEGDKLECYTVQLSDDTIPFKNAPYDGCMALYQYSVLTISKALEAFGIDNLKARWNSEIFQEAVAEGLIYRGNCSDEEEDFVALTGFYNQLVTFFSNAASRKEAIIYYVH